MINNIFDVECKDKSLLKKALTHPSYTKENNLSHKDNYEVLEFFGDSVLKLYSSRLLIQKYPECDEGKLSKIRSILVSDATIAKIAFEIGLDKKIVLGDAEEKQGGRNRESNIACSFEAVLGAYYLSSQKDIVEEFLDTQLVKYIEDIDEHFEKYNAKAVLQEYTQSKTKDLPVYKTIGTKGPAHNPEFEVEVSYQGNVIATATGQSKKEAQQNCAYKACQNLNII